MLFILILLCSAGSAYATGEYRTVEVESLKIVMDSEWAGLTAPGYLPVRFDITNLGDARAIEIVGQGTRWFGFGPGGTASGGIDVRQTLRLNRGDRVRLTVPVPIYADNENIQFQIHERGRTLTSFTFVGLQSGKPLDDAAALIIADPVGGLSTAAGWTRTVTPFGRYTPPGGVTVRTGPRLDFVLDPARVPEDWLGFTSLRAVLIGPREWEQLNESQRTALLTWTACGGDLMFVDGDLKTLFPDKQNRPQSMGDGSGPSEPYFLGRIYFPKSPAITAAGLADTLASARDVVQISGWALPANRAPDWGRIAERGFRLAIPGVEGVPARAYAAILVLFSLLIGPVNYAFLWRKKQQVLLVLTVPIISALFIALLAGYAVLGEGFGVRGRAETFTVLDQTTKQAATRSSMSLYAAGMSPSGGLRFSRDMAVFPIGPDGRGSRERLSVDLTNSQRVSSGIMRARAPSNMEQVGFRPARERLSFTLEGGQIHVVNGLGGTVTQLFYRNGDKVYTLHGPLAAGEKTVLQLGIWKGSTVFSTIFPDLKHTHSPAPEKYHRVIDDQAGGSYVAILERSPFWDPGIQNIDERGSLHVVLGYVEGEP